MSHKHDDVPTGLVPRHLDYGGILIPFLYETLSAMQWLSDEPSVEQYVRADPQAQHAILDLNRSLAETGRRVMAALGKESPYDEHLRHYTPDELWMADLAIDVVAMFATSGGLRGQTHDSVLDRLRRAEEHTGGHHWKREVHKAGAGPAEFRELRAHIPARQSR
jgi:hypothetical protein